MDAASDTQLDDAVLRMVEQAGRLLEQACEAAIFAYDRACRLVYCSERMEALCGLERAHALGRDVHEALPGLASVRRDEPRLALLGQRYRSAPDAAISDRPDASRVLQSQYLPLTSERGQVVGGIGVVRDITPRAVTEHEWNAHVTERKALRDALRDRDELLSLISHELRTPMMTLELQLELLQRDTTAPLSKQQHSIMQRMDGSSTRLSTLVESVLQLSRIARGEPAAQRQPLDLTEVASVALEKLQLDAERKRLQLHMQAPARLPLLVSDPVLVHAIVSSLVWSAIKRTPRGGVELVLSCADQCHHISVHDTGQTPTRVSQKELPGQGMGLGLAWVNTMTCALAGRLHVHSELGCGSLFTVVLPSR